MSRYCINRSNRTRISEDSRSWLEIDKTKEIIFGMPHYSPTPLRNLAGLAKSLGIGGLLVKDESDRLRVNSFKILGVTNAIGRLFESGRLSANSHLVCATDGNHGFALAFTGRLHGLKTTVCVPQNADRERIGAIQREGAEVLVVNGNYEAALAKAVEVADKNKWVLVADTSWNGYEQIPKWIMGGYSILMEESAMQWGPAGTPDIFIVQVGCGSLAATVASWLTGRYGDKRPLVICCEPLRAACLLESVLRGYPVTVEGSLETLMVGLSCGRVSQLAWPILSESVDCVMAISDQLVPKAMQMLANPASGDEAIIAGETGAGGLAALLSLMTDPSFQTLRGFCKLGSQSRVQIINTEGATNRQSYESIMNLDLKS